MRIQPPMPPTDRGRQMISAASFLGPVGLAPFRAPWVWKAPKLSAWGAAVQRPGWLPPFQDLCNLIPDSLIQRESSRRDVPSSSSWCSASAEAGDYFQHNLQHVVAAHARFCTHIRRAATVLPEALAPTLSRRGSIQIGTQNPAMRVSVKTPPDAAFEVYPL